MTRRARKIPGRQVRIYPDDHARLLVKQLEMQAVRPSVTLSDVVREALDEAGFPPAPEPLRKKR